MTVDTRVFGTLRGVVTLPVVVEDGEGRVVWSPHLRLPGLRPGDAVRRRGARLARGGRPCWPPTGAVSTASRRAAGIVGKPPAGDKPGTGIEGAYDERLGGRPGAELRFGDRVVARVKRKRGRSVHATIRPGLQRATTAALGSRLGGVAVINPRDGDVLALAGLAVSAPQPPGSTFKIITLSAALPGGDREAVEHVSGAHVRDALGRQAAQREQRVLRRHADQLVRASRATRCSRRSAPSSAPGG